MDELVKRLTQPVPSARQLHWQQLEFTAFIHYGMNTFTNREWGDGTEDVALFNPTQLNMDNWCEALLSGGIRGVLFTAKHHDGFCLWDTQTTSHNVMQSPYGQDLVAQLAAACRRHKLAFGIYLSPWDRHEPCYGTGEAYNDFLCRQLTELTTNYGELYCVWFDGACGEGPNGKRQQYSWQRYYDIIRKNQPGAVISVCGPDVRWCGNEAGSCRPSEWSVVAASMRDNEKIQEASQQADDAAFRQQGISSREMDLGSREVLRNVEQVVWYPAEVNTSIRPGWFYHPEEDAQVKTLAELQHLYLQAAGGNAMLLLNIPPHKNGYIAPPDTARLAELGAWLQQTFSHNILAGATLHANNALPAHPVQQLQQGGYWQASGEGEAPVITIACLQAIQPRYFMLMEEIRCSQRIEAFIISAKTNAGWQPVYHGTTVGYKRICQLVSPPAAKEWRIEITACRDGATLNKLAAYGSVTSANT